MAFPPVLMMGVSLPSHILHSPAPGAHGAAMPLTAITDRAGNRIDVLRDAAGSPAERRHSGGTA